MATFALKDTGIQKIGLTTIRKLMKSATSKPISAEAAYLVREKVTELLLRVTKDAEGLLSQRNELRKTQGLKEKQRIDEALILEVLRRY